MEAFPVIAGKERSPLALRLSLTDRCQLRCVYCRPEKEVESVHAPEASGKKIIGVTELVKFVTIAQSQFGVSKVRLTGGEPLLRPDLVEIVQALAGIGITDLALTTNGQLLYQQAARLKQAGLQRINISLDSLQPETFRHLTRTGHLELTLRGIEAALQANLHPVRLNTVVMRGFNDQEAEELMAFALESGCELRFIELMPTGLSPADFQRLHLPAEKLRGRLEKRLEMVPLPYQMASSGRRFWVRDGANRTGIVGFISPISHPFCHGCRRLRLTAFGDLFGCLARCDYWPVAAYLRAHFPESEPELIKTMQRALDCKRTVEHFAAAAPMSAIGG